MKRRGASIAVVCLVAWAIPGRAQVTHRRFPPPPTHAPQASPSLSEDPRDLRGRFGAALAARLIQSSDAEERLRGLERAGASGSSDAVALLARARDASMARTDGRADIAIARGLALHLEEPLARASLLALTEPPAAARAPRDEESRDVDRSAQSDLARRIAAVALAQSGDGPKIERLAQIARGNGVGSEAAEAALVAFPPMTASPLGRLTARAMRLLARTGDRRESSAMVEMATSKGNDAETRAAAIESLAALGDARVLEVARTIKAEDDPRLRMAAATAFVSLGAPEAPGAVEQLMADDLTAGRGIALALDAHGPGVVRALAAQALVTSDATVRRATVAALGRDPTGEGIEALVALARDAAIRVDALNALARSPAPQALPALEKLAGEAASRRSAVRAYVVRSLVRGVRSDVLEHVAGGLSRSKDGTDRAVGVFAQVALGREVASRWIDDPHPQVRRAAAMGAESAGRPDTRRSLTQRWEHEDDAATRVVLAGVLGATPAEGEAVHVTTGALLGCARAGGGDAPSCAFAFARRAASEDEADLVLLLRSGDPVLRANTARGLALGNDPTRSGRLAEAYAYETVPFVRSAIVAGFATCFRSPAVADALSFASRFDPDGAVRWTAGRVQTGASVDGSVPSDIVWLHLLDPTGGPPPAGMTGALVDADGLAIPVVFDADGDALVPGVVAGSARLVLAPQLGAAYAPSP